MRHLASNICDETAPVWGRGTWKMNKTVLEDKGFTDEIGNLINIHKLNKYYYDITEAWDNLKADIKTIAIKTSIRNSRKDKDELTKLTDNLINTKAEIDNGNTGGPGVITNIEMVQPGDQYTSINTLLNVRNVAGGGTGAQVLRVCDNSNFGSSQFGNTSEVYPFDCYNSLYDPGVKFATFQRVLQPTATSPNQTTVFSALSGAK